MAVGSKYKVFFALEALKDRDFRLLWSSNLASYLTRWIEVIVLGWLVLEVSNSPLYVALVGAVRNAPMLFFGPIAGVLSDRFDRRMLVLVNQGSSIAITAVMLALLLTGRLELWHVFAASLALGLFAANDWPARRGLLVDIVGEQRLVNAVAVDTISLMLSGILGGLAGGIFLATAGVTGSYVAMLAIYIVGFMFLYDLQVAPSTRTSNGSAFVNLAEGIRYALSKPIILATLGITFAMNLLVFPYKQLLPVFARDDLHVGPEQLGLLAAADGIGALIGTTIMASLIQLHWKGMTYLVGSLVMGLALFLFSLSDVYGLSIVLLICLGFGFSGFHNMQSSIILLDASPEMRGRMIGILALVIGAGPVGMVLLGALATLMGALEAVRIGAAFLMLTVGAVFIFVPQLRRF